MIKSNKLSTYIIEKELSVYKSTVNITPASVSSSIESTIHFCSVYSGRPGPGGNFVIADQNHDSRM